MFAGGPGSPSLLQRSAAFPPPKTRENLPTHFLLVTPNGQELCTEKKFLLAEEGVVLNDWLLGMQADSWPPWRKTWKQWI